MTVVLTSTKGLMDGTHGHALLNGLNEQRTKGLFCDVTIVVEDIKFKAHRNVLAACSGYFRNAFSSTEVWTSGQVLELLDLRSEVFASILNFIYSSKVAPAGTEDVRLLVAAGKKLGIPFLEKLVEREKRSAIVPQGLASSDRVKAASPRHTPLSLGPQPLKRETPRPEYTDCASGPRITNAFSITEAGAGNNPFTPLDLRNDGQPSPEPVQLLTPNSTPTPSEPVHTLSEHSYAVSQTHKGTEHTEDNQADGIKNIQPTHVPPRQQASLNSGPLKKRHRLSCTNFESIPDTFAIPMQRKISCTTPLSATTTPETLSTLPNLNHPKTTETERPVSENASTKESDSPPLVFRCEYCPETFGNRATLNRHTQTHKKRFVSHLFCKFCRRKFMHLKRLRNHEQVCSKALRSTSQQDLTCTEASITLAPDNLSNTDERTLLWQSPSLPDSPNNPSTQTDSPEIQQEAERGVRMVEGQRLYKCSMCKRAYVTLSSLRRHENVHSWQRAYPCHYCNKVFALAEYRTKHEIWHTGERRYQCIFCLETFMTYYILKNHQKSFHGIDPRLVVKKKSANGGFKGSVYPIKLYRLLPMKFRKRQYKTYSQTFSEPVDCNSQNLPLPLSCRSPSTGFEENVTLDNTDGVSVGQSLFSMPVTFMATPKVVASVTPRVNFDQPCDKDVAKPLSSDTVCPQRTRTSASSETDLCTTLSNAGTRGSSVISYRYTPPTVPMQPSRVSSVIVHGNNMASGSHNKTLSDNTGLPFMETNNANSSEPTERLVDFPAASHIMEDISDHLSPEESFRAKTETYIAKPACPGPSMDSHVLPLCQITVKIGDEAIVRRRIKGSKLFPRKRKRSHWSQVEEGGQRNLVEKIDKFPSLRLRTEVTSVKEAEPLDDATERDTADQLWRPYYSYKPKKKAKKLRAKQRKCSQSRLPGRPTKDAIRAPGFKAVEDYQETGYGPKEKIPSDTEPIRRRLKKNSQKTTYTCDICKSPFYSLSTLRTHVISCRSYLCGTCGKPCSPEEAPGLKSPAEGRDLICKRCVEDGSCFENTRNPNTEKRYRCSFCPQRFLYLATKKSHEKKHIEKHGKGYSCYYCPKVCKTSMSLSVHQKKHLIKTEEAEVDRKQPAGSFPSLSEGMEGTKPEGWAISEVDTSLTPKLEDQVEINSIGHYQQFKQSKVKTLMSPCESSLPILPTEVPQGKPWKSHRVDLKHLANQCGDNKCQGSVDGQAFSNKELPPTPGMNSHCNTGQFSLSHMKTDPVHYSTDSSFPKSELMNSCKEEPSFHTLH